jgi:hypothetical protein
MKKLSIFFGIFSLVLAQKADANSMSPSPILIPPPIFLSPRAIPCSEALKPYFDWASGATSAPEDVRWVQFTLIYNQNRNTSSTGLDSKPNLAGYFTGPMKLNGGNLTGDTTAFFSDRMYCPDAGGGGFCLASAPFNAKATDVVGIVLALSGKMTSVLKSWGNSTSSDDLVCLDNGVLYAPSKAGQRSMSVITLQKAGYRSPR